MTARVRETGPATHRRRVREGNPSGRDRGYTFIEVIVGIVLLGVVVVPILSATQAAIGASSVSETAAEVETLLVNAVDRVSRAPSPGCDFSSYARAAVETHGWSAGAAAVEQFYRDHAGAWIAGAAGSPACPSGGYQNGMVQMVRISITSPNGDITRTLEVVKGDI